MLFLLLRVAAIGLQFSMFAGAIPRLGLGPILYSPAAQRTLCALLGVYGAVLAFREGRPGWIAAFAVLGGASTALVSVYSWLYFHAAWFPRESDGIRNLIELVSAAIPIGILLRSLRVFGPGSQSASPWKGWRASSLTRDPAVRLMVLAALVVPFAESLMNFVLTAGTLRPADHGGMLYMWTLRLPLSGLSSALAFGSVVGNQVRDQVNVETSAQSDRGWPFGVALIGLALDVPFCLFVTSRMAEGQTLFAGLFPFLLRLSGFATGLSWSVSSGWTKTSSLPRPLRLLANLAPWSLFLPELSVLGMVVLLVLAVAGRH